MGSKFVIADPRLCVGCHSCMAACLVKHFVPGDVPMARLNVVSIGNGMTTPIVCHHCEDAPCAAACPTTALYHDGDRVAVDISRCIGCRSCVIACPFGAVEIVSRQSTARLRDVKLDPVEESYVIKCDRCVDRENGPACVEACTSHALRLVSDTDFRQTVAAKHAKTVESPQSVL